MGTRRRPHRPLHPPSVWASLRDHLPPNLCRARDRSSPSVMVSLVNTSIREFAGRVTLGGWGRGVWGPRHPRLHTTVPLGELPGWEEMPWGRGEGRQARVRDHLGFSPVPQGGSQPGVCQAAATLALPLNPPQTPPERPLLWAQELKSQLASQSQQAALLYNN